MTQRREPTIDIVDRLKFDAVRCEQQFSKGVAGNINDAVAEIERLRAALKEIQAYSVGDPRPRHTWYYDRAEEALRANEQAAPRSTDHQGEQGRE